MNVIEVTTKLNGEDEERTIQITFSFPDKRKPIKKQKVTRCFLKTLTGNTNEYNRREWVVVIEGQSVCKTEQGDVFNKAKGRKQAFTNTVNKILEKDIRTFLWEEYFKVYPKDKMI